MLTQLSFIDRPAAIELRDPNVRPKDVRRLRGQCRAVLLRLIEGPATARDLAAISLKYTSRTSDLRALGCVITLREHVLGGDYYVLDYCPDGLIGGEG